MDRKPIVVAVVDSGIDTGKSELNNYVTKCTGFSVNPEGCIVEDQTADIKHPHGTAIAMIIKHLCQNIEFISVNILNERLTADGRILLYALEQVLKYQPDIIHLSLGVTKWKYKLPLGRIVKKAMKSNIHIVAAANNKGIRSYPAYLKGVIGVKGGSFKDKSEFYYKDKFFYAPPDTENIPGMEAYKCRCMRGTSMSAAYMTGHIANLLTAKTSLSHEALKELLIAQALDLNEDDVKTNKIS